MSEIIRSLTCINELKDTTRTVSIAELNFGVHSQVQISALPFTSYMALRKLLKLSESQFPHLENGHNVSSYSLICYED